MKGPSLCLLCVMISGAVGSAVFWPGAIPYSAPLVKSVLPAQVKAFGYSTSQYIGGVPHSYTVRYQPQLSYQVPYAAYTPFQGYPAYQPVISSYYPSIYYPSAPIAPIFPIAQEPPKEQPAAQQPGDEDTSIVDSADNTNAQPEKPSSDMQLPSLPQLPSFPQLPSLPQLPSYPQLPQTPFPSFPQPPQSQQPQLPGFPSLPQTPSPSPPASFPSADDSDKGLNDEDTVSIESAK